jgi:hypothetical protein
LFKGSTYFNRDRFAQTANFKSINFNNVRFDQTVFEGDAFFSNSSFDSSADFERTQSLKELNFEDAVFKGGLNFAKTKYGILFIRWNNINNLTYDEASYIYLIKYFKNNGIFNDADNCYYQFRTMQFMNRNWLEEPVLSLLDMFAWIFYGYEKRPHFPVLWSLYFIILFGFFWMPNDAVKTRWTIEVSICLWSLLFVAFFGYFFLRNLTGTYLSTAILVIFSVFLIIVRSKMKKDLSNKRAEIWQSLILDALCFSATVFLSGTRLFVDPPAAIPELKGISHSSAKKIIILERLLGALFSVLFLLAITGIVIKTI